MLKKLFTFDTIATIILVAMVIYTICCTCEITFKGDKPNPQYSEYNIIVKLTDIATEYHNNK